MLNTIAIMEGRREKVEQGVEGKIAKARIPDADMAGWIESLREGGFDDKEIDEILLNLNPAYKEQKFSPRMKAAFDEFVALIEESSGGKMTPEARAEIVEKLKSSSRKPGQEQGK